MVTEMETMFSKALGIEAPWEVVNLSFNSELKKLDIAVDFIRGSSFPYEDPSDGTVTEYKAYDTVQKTWRHLNFFEHECYITARVPRIKPKSGGIKMIFPPWSGKVYGFTLLFESLIIQMSRSMPVHNVAKILRISDHKIWHVLECYIALSQYESNLTGISTVGIDETSVCKGHEYISLFVDLDKKSTVFVAEGKDHSTVSEFTKMLSTKGVSKEAIKDVSCDMSPAFIKGVGHVLRYERWAATY